MRKYVDSNKNTFWILSLDSATTTQKKKDVKSSYNKVVLDERPRKKGISKQ